MKKPQLEGIKTRAVVVGKRYGISIHGREVIGTDYAYYRTGSGYDLLLCLDMDTDFSSYEAICSDLTATQAKLYAVTKQISDSGELLNQTGCIKDNQVYVTRVYKVVHQRKLYLYDIEYYPMCLDDVKEQDCSVEDTQEFAEHFRLVPTGRFSETQYKSILCR